MEGLALIATIAVIVDIILVFVAGNIAQAKGRNAFGWAALQLIFPIAILFVLIAPSEK